MNETEFIGAYPDVTRVYQADSCSCRAYETKDYFWLFDREDGHLVWQQDKVTGVVIYKCEHVIQAVIPPWGN